MSKTIPDEVAAEVLAKCGRCCCLCRRYRPTMLQVHHIIEQSQGGTNDLDNLIAVCLTCHSDVHTHRPFTRRFTADELKHHRDAVLDLVARGKLVPPDDDYDRLGQRYQGVAVTADALQEVLSNGVQLDLTPEAVDILIAAAESNAGQVVMLQSSSFSISIDGQFLVQTRAPREEARYKHAMGLLSDNDLLDGYDTVFTVTHPGFLLADHLLALRARTTDD